MEVTIDELGSVRFRISRQRKDSHSLAIKGSDC